MNVQDKVMSEMKLAMRAKDSGKLEALRAVKSAILLAQTDTGGKQGLTEDEELKLLQKLVKQRKESAAIYKEQGREDLAQPELEQAAVIEQFLPEQMSEAEIERLCFFAENPDLADPLIWFLPGKRNGRTSKVK